MRSQTTGLALILGLLTLGPTQADIYPYGLVLGDYETTNNLRYRQSGMFSPRDAPSKTAPGNGRSFIDVGNLEFTAIIDPDETNAAKVTIVEVAVFESEDFSKLGKANSDGSIDYCCTDPSCTTLNAPTSIDVYKIPVPHTGEPVKLKAEALLISNKHKYEKYQVKDTGMYTVLLANCDRLNPLSIAITGQSEWLNPFGYLPGEFYGLMPFFGVLACLYVILGIVWMVLCALNWSELLILQMWISLVIGLGMLETTIKFGDYLAWNASGSRETGALATGLVFGVTKRALSRVLVVMASLGYSIVKPSLGAQLPRILLLGTAYFVLAMVYDLLVDLPGTNQYLGSPGVMDSLTLIVILMSLVDVIFYMWILQAMIQTINYLEERRQTVKLQLFRRFRLVLILSVLFSVAWAIYTMAASVDGYYEAHWKSEWSVNAVWEVLYILILMAIAFLWMPSRNSQRYAYSMELATIDPDDDDAEYGGALEDDGDLDELGMSAGPDSDEEDVSAKMA